MSTYGEIGGRRVSFTPTADGCHVAVISATAHHGFYLLDRFGPDPVTPAGRLRAGAIRHFADYLAGAS